VNPSDGMFEMSLWLVIERLRIGAGQSRYRAISHPTLIIDHDPLQVCRYQ